MKINLNLKDTRKYNKHTTFSIGSGHASLALRKDYVELLKYVHDNLGIKRVRFHDIFSDNMNVYKKLSDIIPVPGAERFEDINFSTIGEVYDNVLSCGMEPIVELSFMPTHLAKNPNQKLMLYYDACVSMPKDDESWTNFIKSFVNFLINRYTKEVVENWLFEVWNEPDLIVFFGGSQQDYFHLYEITSKAIKEVDPLIKVGGPSTSGSKWIKEFLNFVKENNLPLDFITTHQYAGDPIGNIDGNDLENKTPEATASPFSNPNILKDVESGSILKGLKKVFIDKNEINDIRNDTLIENSKQIKKLIGDIPLYYTEWNESATFSAYTNDTRKVSAYIIMTALKMEQNVDGSCVWCFSDLFEELHMFSEEFQGGFGLLTRHGIKKPSYYAMEFLNSLPLDRYNVADTYGDITVGAFDNKDEIVLLVTRQNMKNLFDLPKEEVEFEINVKACDVLVKGITEDSGNPLKEFERIGSPLYISKKEIEDIKEKSSVLEHHLEYTQNENTVSFKLNIGINDSYQIRIKK